MTEATPNDRSAGGIVAKPAAAQTPCGAWRLRHDGNARGVQTASRCGGGRQEMGGFWARHREGHRILFFATFGYSRALRYLSVIAW